MRRGKTRTLGLMRHVALVIGFAVLAGGCMHYPQLDAITASWKDRIDAAIVPGMDATAATAWFEKEGLKPAPQSMLGDRKGTFVLLGSVRAREWFCDEIMQIVFVETTPDGKVKRH